jgi:hypothetical protein
MKIREAVNHVRKHGSVKVGTKAQAELIVTIAAAEGYTFTQRKQGWDFLIEDAGEKKKKQTAGNNEFLKEVKTKFNTPIYKRILKEVNENGTEAGKQELFKILKSI